jgi:RNA polymerase sigma factor (TIGR02999 family)
MATPSPKEITQLLVAWGDGDEAALEQLTPLVYQQLHRLAHHYLSHERPGHTLQTSALVNEAYVRLIDWKNVQWQNRAHFFGVSAQLMRRILVDFARSRRYEKRGGGKAPLALDEVVLTSGEKSADMVALDEALLSLEKLDARQSRVVELRFFGGLTVAETAEVLKVSEATVRRDWSIARAWLRREMLQKSALNPQ